MQGFNLDNLTQVPIDLNDPNISDKVKKLQPTMYTEGTGYFCLLGTDPRSGVFGCGHTADTALFDWEKRLNERIETGNENDPMLSSIRERLDAVKGELPFETPNAKGLS